MNALVVELELDAKNKELVRIDQISSVSVEQNNFGDVSHIHIYMFDETNFEITGGYAAHAYNVIKPAMMRLSE